MFDRRQLIQEFVPGEVHDACFLFCHGSAIAALTQRRLKMYPSQGGQGTYNETTNNSAVRDRAQKLLEALRWHGPAQVEFRVDPRDGVPKLMEINGRFWGTLALSVVAGVDFPWLTCQMGLGKDLDSTHTYRTGLKYRWPHPFALGGGGDGWRAWREFWEFVRFESGTSSDVWLTDPLPALARIGCMIGFEYDL
jgi:predicted ATP-grasp superfamily ATP-dependent carboligase